MHGRKENNLILIENGQITSYALDNKKVWEIGRPSKNNNPDIKLYSTTVSRKHGKFQNMDGVWFYLDNNGKNGTFYNHKHLEAGFKGQIKPVMLNDGDVFVFGGGEEEVINCKTVWGIFVTRAFDNEWRIADTKGYKHLRFISEEDTMILDEPKKGLVFGKNGGMAIYMGDLTYVIGDVTVAGC